MSALVERRQGVRTAQRLTRTEVRGASQSVTQGRDPKSLRLAAPDGTAAEAALVPVCRGR